MPNFCDFFCEFISARRPSNWRDSSVVTRCTVDQEVVGSNPTHGGNLISVVRSLSGFTQPIRYNEYRLSVAWVLHIELGLKIWVYVLRWLAVVSDCTGVRVENDTRPARHKQYTHEHRIYSPYRTTLLWLHGLCKPCRARCEKQHKSHLITWARIRQVLTPREVE